MVYIYAKVFYLLLKVKEKNEARDSIKKTIYGVVVVVVVGNGQ